MVDSFNIPKRMTKTQLEWWILFGICVAGKGAKQTQTKLKSLLDDIHLITSTTALSPFECIHWAIKHKLLGQILKKHKMGKYKLLNKAFRAAIKLNLNSISIEALEKIPGIGPKTARMTILYYEPKANCVPLDTHVLKFLRTQGYNAPKSTPSSQRKYLELEQAFITEAKHRNKTVRELDTEVWQNYANRA